MERDGLISRHQSPGDRRETHIKLTPKAQKCKKDVYNCAKKLNEAALKGFSDNEKEQLSEYLARIIENMS